MDRLTSLTVFGQVVRSGNFSTAARRLNMSVSSVSSHVQALEDRLGARLFNRTTRKVKLTDVGQAYYDRSSRIIADLEEADRAAGSLRDTPMGLLRIYASSSFIRFLAPVVGEYLDRYPGVAADVVMGESMVDLIESGIDLAVRPTPLDGTGMTVRLLTPWRPMLCCSSHYRDTHERLGTPIDLARHNCIRYSAYPSGSEWNFDGPDGTMVSVVVDGNFTSNSPEMLRARVLGGGGILMAPGFVIGEDFGEGRLVRLLPAYPPIQFTISAITPSGLHPTAKVRMFLDLLAERWADYQTMMETGQAVFGGTGDA